MRVKGTFKPAKIEVEVYPFLTGYINIRIRGEVTEKVEINPRTGGEKTFFIYDEYSIINKDREGILQDISENFEKWLETGRALEANEGASLIRDMREALEILGVDE